jgi:hypothetical protein
VATAPEQLKRRTRTEEPDTEAVQSFFEASAEAAREYLAVTNAAALDSMRNAFAAQNEGLKAWTQAVQAGQSAATKIAVAGTKLVEDTIQPK